MGQFCGVVVSGSGIEMFLSGGGWGGRLWVIGGGVGGIGVIGGGSGGG